MALAYNHEEITPRELKPALLELDGISRETVEAHYKLYQGYVNKRNEILGKLDGVDLSSANQVYSELRALKVDLTFAIGGIKNHEIYFEHLGGHGGDPAGIFGDLVKRDFGSVADWKADLKATGLGGARLGVDGLRLGRGAALQLHRRRAEHVPGVECDAARRARRLRARLLHRLRDRPRLVHRRVPEQPRLRRRERLGPAVRHSSLTDPEYAPGGRFGISACRAGLPATLMLAWRSWDSSCSAISSARAPGDTGSFCLVKHEDIRKVGSGNIGATNVWRTYGRWLGAPVVAARRPEGLRPGGARDALRLPAPPVRHLAGAAAMLGHWRPLFLRFAKGGKMVATCGGVFFGVARRGSRSSPGSSGSSSSWSSAMPRSPRRRRDRPAGRALRSYGYPLSVVLFGVAAAAAILYLHRGNLRRLRAGTETSLPSQEDGQCVRRSSSSLSAAALWLAPGALAAGWCGNGEAVTDRADIVTGAQVHAIVATPADAPDQFGAVANRLQDDVDSMNAWWAGQDPTRQPRFDQATFGGTTCLDISFVHLPQPASAYDGRFVLQRNRERARHGRLR